MKRLISISLILLVLASLSYGGENISAEGIKPNIFAGVIRDTSPTSEKNWNLQNALNIEVFHSLREGDRLKELLARPGKPSILIDSIITADGSEKNYILNNISGISKEWLSSADIARAMEAAFDSFIEKGKNYQCLLIIITKGQMSNDHVAYICRYAGAFKARGWPVCIVCDKEQANRTLLVAANNREFDVQFTDKTSLSDWIDNVRGTFVRKSSKDTKIQKDELELKIPDKQPSKVETGKTAPYVPPVETAKSPIEVKIVELPRKKAFVDANKPMEGQTQAKAKVKQGAGADNKVNDSKKRKSSVLDIIPIAILLTMILGAIGSILYATSKSTSKSTSQKAADADENKQHHLIAFVFDQRYDLGPLDTLGEITIGKGIGSTIYIDNETIEDKHLRIFRNRNGLKVQNLALSPIIVNGSELTHRQKTILDLPADIELTPEVTVTILSEPLEQDKEANSYETENI
jgi:hypothetical protein